MGNNLIESLHFYRKKNLLLKIKFKKLLQSDQELQITATVIYKGNPDVQSLLNFLHIDSDGYSHSKKQPRN